MKKWTQTPHFRVINNKSILAGKGGKELKDIKSKESLFDEINKDFSPELQDNTFKHLSNELKKAILNHPYTLELPLASQKVFSKIVNWADNKGKLEPFSIRELSKEFSDGRKKCRFYT